MWIMTATYFNLGDRGWVASIGAMNPFTEIKVSTPEAN